LLDCKLQGVRVYDLATHFEKTLGQIRLDFRLAGWLIFGDGFNQGLLAHRGQASVRHRVCTDPAGAGRTGDG
jgi:hypothetical protein